MDGSSRAPGRRTLTPAVLAAALFTACCAVTAITFVAARGGLQVPIAPTPPAVALASTTPTDVPSTAPTEATIAPTPADTLAPTLTPTPTASATASPLPTAVPSPGAPTLPPSDPLLALPGCPGLPGCFEYTIQRGDSLTGVAGRYRIPVSIVLALNPELTDPSIVVVGHVLYLGRDPFLRLPPCPDATDCSLYTIRAGDTVSSIAGRFSITVAAILGANPSITDPSAIVTGQVLRLPHLAA